MKRLLFLLFIFSLCSTGCFYGDVDKVNWSGPGQAEPHKFDNYGRGGELR